MEALQCANCDSSLESSLRYACSDCPSDQSPACGPCSRALHRPARTRRHRLRLLHPQGDAAARAAVAACRPGGRSGDDDEQTEVALAGRGFCDECAAADPAAASSVPLAELECQQCGSSAGLCMSCDSVLHRSLERDAHTRQYFDDDAAEVPPQRAHFSLAGQCGLSLLHRDAMPSYAGRIWPGSMMLARYCEQKERDEPGYWSGKKIIELGCGCAAIPSITCWLMGASSLLCTDMNQDGLDILEENIAAVREQVAQRRDAAAGSGASAAAAAVAPPSSSLSSAASASAAASAEPVPPAFACSGDMSTRGLAFGEDASGLGSFDVVLGSYILYDPDSFIPLAATLGQLTSERTTVLLTSHEPTRERALLDALAERGLVAQRVPFSLQSAQLSDETHTDVARSDLGTGLRSTSILVIRRKENGQD